MLTTRHAPDLSGPYRCMEVELPAYWCTYLINADASGLDDAELQEANEVEEFLLFSGYRICDVLRDGDDPVEPFIGRYDGKLCDMLTYVCDYYSELDQS